MAFPAAQTVTIGPICIIPNNIGCRYRLRNDFLRYPQMESRKLLIGLMPHYFTPIAILLANFAPFP